jgi:tryptophanyl-tRNA synthetase
MRILSGMQPTGYLHLGNYIGALQNWVKLQNDDVRKPETYYFIADLHSLTSNQTIYQKEGKDYIFNMVVDWLAAGIDPNKSVIFQQSDIPEHTELYTILSMITPIPWLERNPTYKEKMDEIVGKELDNLGFLGYPILQAADIALYKADSVPVGRDQIPHLEISREIVRRFNYLYGKEVLVEPQPLLAPIAKLNGLDGRKMSKSYNNAIFLSDDEATVKQKVMSMVTDVKRARKVDPGHPDECNLYPYYVAFCDDEKFKAQIREDCTSAKMGCVEDKQKLVTVLLDFFSDFRKKREEILKDKNLVNDILKEGAKKAGAVARKTMEEVREAVGFSSKNRYGV